MQLRISHLRRGELIAAASAVALVVVLFALSWFGTPHATLNGWHSLPVLRWLVVVSAWCGLLLAVFQQTRRAPALPVVMSVIVTALSLLTAIVLVIRLLTSADTPQVGAYLGVVCVLAMLVGGFYSMRDEDGWQPGPDHPVERVPLRTSEPH
jgi:hypothetical protein